MAGSVDLEQVPRSDGGTAAVSLWPRMRTYLVFGASVFYATLLGYAAVAGGARTVVLLLAIPLVALAVLRPNVLFWALVPVLALFDEGTYGLLDSGSTFRIHSYGLGPLNVDELLVYALVAVLLVHFALRSRERAAIPASAWIAATLVAVVYIAHLVATLASGVPMAQAMDPAAGKYVLLLVVAWWSFAQVLKDRAVRMRLLDVLFVACGARAVYALVRFVFGSGDPANAYRALGLKVTMWETADHQLFTLLIASALAAWLLGAVGRRRLVWWLVAVVPMVLTIGLSYRRIALLGGLATILILSVFLWRRGGIRLLAGLTAASVGAMAVMSQRFGAGASLSRSLLADVDATDGTSRLYEWALALKTISRNPLLGGGLMAERASGQGEWTATIVHNGFIFVWMKLGAIGLAGLVFFFGAISVQAWRRSWTESQERFLGIAVLAMLPYVAFDIGSGTPLLHVRSVLVFSLVFALAVTVGSQSKEADHRPGEA